MHIAYLDESGTQKDARYFVLAGLIVFERNTLFLARELERIQAKYLPRYSDTAAFHAASLRAPSQRVPAPFNRLSQDERFQLISDVYQVITDSPARIITVAIEKAAIEGDPYERGFEEIVSRFDLFLRRIYRERGKAQSGLIVVAESTYRKNLELQARRIAQEGHRWGEIYNLADIPYFAPAQNTRLLQLADFIANAVFGKYESGHAKNFDRLIPKFDQDADGRIHGLVHLVRNRDNCYCPACMQRRISPLAGS